MNCVARPALGTRQASASSLHGSSAHGHQYKPARASPLHRLARPHPTRRRGLVCLAAPQRTLYEVLGVPPTADARAIKAAYRSKALKLHPDVNKAADAQERFVEAKTAFEKLNDAGSRAEYDRALRMGFFDGSSRAWSGNGTSSSGRPRASPPPDDYGFSDFFRDLDRDVGDLKKKRAKDAAAGGSKPGRPAGGANGGRAKTLWEELDEIGDEVLGYTYGFAEEFVSFLEETLGTPSDPASSQQRDKERGPGGGASSSPSSSGGDGGSTRDSSASWRDAGPGAAGSTGRDGGSSSSAGGAGGTGRPDEPKPPPPPPPPPAAPPPPTKKALDDEVEDMLQALKRKLNKDRA